MNLDFDLNNVTLTEFGVGIDKGKGQEFVQVPVDAGVQQALLEMAQETWQRMSEQGEPQEYEPSEKYEGTVYVVLPLSDEMARLLGHLHEAANLDTATTALSNPTDVFCYLARFKDREGGRLTAIRRATQFKGILKSKGRLVRILDDTLKIIEDTVFKLDNDFDMLIDSQHVHILRPSGFEFFAKAQDAILNAVPTNVNIIMGNLPFVDFSSIEEYAKTHPRAARYLASIKTQNLVGINKKRLRDLCKRTGVNVSESDGKLVIARGGELGFLEVLDRRRFEVELIKNQPERYRAPSRKRIDQ